MVADQHDVGGTSGEQADRDDAGELVQFALQRGRIGDEAAFSHPQQPRPDCRKGRAVAPFQTDARITRNLAFVQGLVTADDVPALRVSGIFKIGKPFTPRQPT